MIRCLSQSNGSPPWVPGSSAAVQLIDYYCSRMKAATVVEIRWPHEGKKYELTLRLIGLLLTLHSLWRGLRP